MIHLGRRLASFVSVLAVLGGAGAALAQGARPLAEHELDQIWGSFEERQVVSSAGDESAPTRPTGTPRPSEGEPLVGAVSVADGTSPQQAPALRDPGFWVQVGAFRDPQNAARLAGRLRAERYPALVSRGKSPVAPHVVWLGKYPTRKRAEAMLLGLERKGLSAFILRDEGG